ncbi:unnamed protein product [Linum trigynum]|uniref:Gnk2-homologous domain-containing protein n=1 Tax=Linum trigynum TaxID=586398 RepID=A0AAV2CAZ3_9ROSI
MRASRVVLTWTTVILLVLCSDNAVPPATGQDGGVTCSTNKIKNGEPIAHAIASLVWILKNSAPSLVKRPGSILCFDNVYQGPGGAAVAYGSAACNSQDVGGCAACLNDALNALSGGCPGCNGGQVTLDNFCLMRFEAYAYCT